MIGRIINSLEVMVARSYMKRRNYDVFISLTAALSVIGIMLAVATLIVVMSVMRGYEKELINKIVGTQGHLVAHVPNGRDAQKYTDILQNNALVKNHHIEVQSKAVLLLPNNQASGVFVHGVQSTAISGEIPQEDGIVISEAMAMQHQLKKGDALKLLAPVIEESAFGYLPTIKTLKILDVYSSGIHSYDIHNVYININMAKKLFKTLATIQIYLNNIYDIHTVEEKLKSSTGMHINNVFSYNQPLIEALRIERVVMSLILFLIIIVAAFNIISSMVMLVKEKRQDIAILMTFGLSRSAVVRIFFLVGFGIGISGTILGLFLGLLVAYNLEYIRQFLEYFTQVKLFDPVVRYLYEIPVDINSTEIANVMLASLTVTTLASLYPAFRAAKLLPAQILRNL